MEKTNIKLTTVIGIYLLVIAGLMLVATVFSVIIFNGFTGERADSTEKQVEEWLDEAKEAEKPDVLSFPQKGDYVIESENEVTESKIENCKKQDMDRFISFYKTSGMSRQIKGREVFIARVVNGYTVYVHYSMKAKGEMLALFLCLAIYILAIFVPSFVLIWKLKSMIYKIAEEKWRGEYETKQEMAQIAHDLKTPLTVIRGNADLLLENNPDPDARESLTSIINNSERIAQSILEILEK